ncbi:MAG: VOC family protein [Candidatus Promineifilaceae bacterium]
MFNRSMPPGVIVPVLAYDDVSSAVSWLCETFGFQERLRIGNHRAQLIFGGASVVVTARSGEDAERPQQGFASHSIMVQVADVDGHYERARAVGARIISSPTDYPFGERQYSVEDPGGYVWTFSQSTADVDPADWGGKLVNGEW